MAFLSRFLIVMSYIGHAWVMNTIMQSFSYFKVKVIQLWQGQSHFLPFFYTISYSMCPIFTLFGCLWWYLILLVANVCFINVLNIIRQYNISQGHSVWTGQSIFLPSKGPFHKISTQSSLSLSVFGSMLLYQYQMYVLLVC